MSTKKNKDITNKVFHVYTLDTDNFYTKTNLKVYSINNKECDTNIVIKANDIDIALNETDELLALYDKVLDEGKKYLKSKGYGDEA